MGRRGRWQGVWSRPRTRRRLGLALAAVLAVATTAGCTALAPPPGDHWLDVVNEYRAVARVAPVVEEPSWSDGTRKHAEYAARTGVLSHSEDPAQPWYTSEGNAAAGRSNVSGSADPYVTERSLVEEWMTAPFHAIGVLDPRLTAVGYGSYRDLQTPLRAAAALDVISGLNGAPATGPVMFPGDGSSVTLTRSGREYPNPLTGCPGYGQRAGLPIVIMLPSPEALVGAQVRTAFLTLDSCAFSGSTYSNPDPVAQDLGRSVLATRNAIVVIPRAPLTPGSTYVVSVATDARTATWSFSVR